MDYDRTLYASLYDLVGARPAFQLNLESVLFTSAAAGSKSSAAAGGGDFGTLTGGGELKLTLIDSSRSGFNASVDKTTIESGATLTVTYSGVTSGDYVSAILLEGGTVKYHASKTPDSSGAGTWEMTLPSGLTAGSSYTLKVFSEQQKGDKQTDYASTPVEITLNSAYTVTCNTAEHGTVEADKTSAAAGTDVTLTVTPATDYELDTLTYKYTPTGGSETTETIDTTITPYTFTMPAANVTVTATFKEIVKPTLTITALNQEYIYNGQLQGPGDGVIYTVGTEVTPDKKVKVEGLQNGDILYSIVLSGQATDVGVYEDKNGIVPQRAVIKNGDTVVTDNYKIEFIAGKLIITDPVAKTYTISCTANPEAGGTVIGGGAYNENTTATLTATAKEGYDFVNWTENGTPVSTDNPYTFNVTEAKDLVANFALKQYTITWQMDDGSVIDTTTVEYGKVPTHADPTKQAIAGKTYVFSGWEPNVVTATGDATYKAVFSDTTNSYTITWQMDDGSVIDTTTVEYGKVPTHADPTKKATEKYTYTFAGWDPEPVAAKEDTAYKAKFTATEITPPEPPAEEAVYYFDSELTTVYWVKGSNQKGALFTVHRDPDDEQAFSHFRRVVVAGRTLTLQEYTAASGSVKIVLHAETLNRLAEGAYTLAAEFDDGYAETTFYVISSGGGYYNTSTTDRYTYVPPSNNPRTGDESNLALWGVLAALSGAGVVLAARKRKRGF